jgi:hypothetical protein
MRAFERDCDDRLRYLLLSARASGFHVEECLAQNLEWDSRVPAIRQIGLERALHQPDARMSLADLLTRYKRTQIEKKGSETFDRNFNASNEVVPGDHPMWCAPPREFGTIVNLSWYTEILRAADDDYDLLRNFPSRPEAEFDWFEARFTTQSAVRQDHFLDQAFAAIHEYLRAKGQKPVWVAEWDRVASILERESYLWLPFVGCEPGTKYRQFIIALRYGPSDGMPPLFRPTQLDSGANHLHFPLPGEIETPFGGFCVNSVQAAYSSYSCSREWIHSPFLWSSEFFTAAGRKCGWVGSSSNIDGQQLTSVRRNHRQYIQDKIPAFRLSWMPSN